MSLTQETLVKLSDVPNVLSKRYPYIPRKPHKHSVWRWTWQGVRGVHLESIKIMGERYTSEEAIDRFWKAAMLEVGVDKQAAKRKRVSNAKRKLQRAGA